MIEIRTSPLDGQDFLSVPISASLFGMKKLSVSQWRSAIEVDLSLVQLFGAAQESDIRHGLGPRIRRFFSSVARSRRDLDELMPLLELLARKHPAGWLLLADVLEERTGGQPDRIIRATQQYLQVVPSDGRAWQRLAILYASTQNYLGEVNALVQKSKLPSTSYGEISSAARRLNALLHDGRLQVDSREKRVLVEQLLRELKLASEQATAADFSQIAWLCLQLQDEREAREYVLRGLELDPSDVHCRRLARRLNLGPSRDR
jgi:tetratricopeptide (TPR) repeat protein